jgi:ABC-type glutathione transport system ATPase component
MIVVSHEVAFARECADKIVFMADGQVVEEGAPSEILTSPKQERTRQFLSLVESPGAEMGGGFGPVQPPVATRPVPRREY